MTSHPEYNSGNRLCTGRARREEIHLAVCLTDSVPVRGPGRSAIAAPSRTNADAAAFSRSRTSEARGSHISRRVDLAQLQHEADDLARTAQTIPTDVASVRKGMLPKDVIDKLKQIEKLSKHLRSELNP